MASATAEKKDKAGATDELLLMLAESDMIPLKDVLGKVSTSTLAAAWIRGQIQFGHTKYSISGNPESWESRPTLIIETGIEWLEPKNAHRARIPKIIDDVELPQARFYQKYQQEVCTSREKDSWEWVNSPEDVKDRPTRWVRRDTNREECAKLYCLYVQLTDKGLADLQAA